MECYEPQILIQDAENTIMECYAPQIFNQDAETTRILFIIEREHVDENFNSLRLITFEIRT